MHNYYAFIIYYIYINMKIILLRHAETDLNITGKFIGCEVDPDINFNGKTQSKITAEYLKSNYNINKMYCSNMQRAKSTVNIVSDILNFNKENIIYTSKLKESCKDLAKKELNPELKKEYKILLADRALNTLNEIINSNNNDDNILIVSHGAIIKSLIKKIMKVDEIEKNVITEVGNCTLTIFDICEDQFKLIKCYDNSHLK